MTDSLHFGTDGWRAIIGEDFTEDNLVKVIDAAASLFKQDLEASNTELTIEEAVLIIGHDCRKDAHQYSQLAAQVAASHGFTVKLSQSYCPTPAVCWSVAQEAKAIGGIILTSSHNPANYLGVKLRMSDGGASPKEFTDRVESALATQPAKARGSYQEVDLVTPYLKALKERVDEAVIREAKLRVVVDPLYGAGRLYLAEVLRDLGVEVVEINNADDPSFDGLHPEPIPPWIDRGMAKVKELGYDACFITDGDADRIGAVDEKGAFVNPHRIITLLVSHLVEDKGLQGRIVSTITSSALLTRQCNRLGLQLTNTPVGFKWIYGEMEKGGVMIGGEESGGIGIPEHVKERDGLLMALLLVETMAQRHMSLGELVEDMFGKLGKMEFTRQGLTISEQQIAHFRNEIIPNYTSDSCCGLRVLEIDRRDGIKLLLEGDAWVMMRPSGTEPLVRIYAEAETNEQVQNLLKMATQIVESQA